jgi:hypothetical protein
VSVDERPSRTEPWPESCDAPGAEADGAANANTVLHKDGNRPWRTKDVRRLIKAKKFTDARELIGQPVGGAREIVRFQLSAEIAEADGRDTESVKYLEEAYTLDPGNTRTVAAYLRILTYTGNYRTALLVCRNLPERLKKKNSIKLETYILYRQIGWVAKAEKVWPGAAPASGLMNRLKGILHMVVASLHLFIEKREEKFLLSSFGNLSVFRDINYRNQYQVYEFQREMDQALIELNRANVRSGLVFKIFLIASLVISFSAVGLTTFHLPGSGSVGFRVSFVLIFTATICFLSYKLDDIIDTAKVGFLLIIFELFICLVTATVLLKSVVSYDQWMGLVGIGLLSASAVLVLLIMVIFIVRICATYYQKQVMRKHALSIVVDILASLLAQIRDVNNRSHLAYRRHWLLKLEQAADILEHYAPRMLPSHDQGTSQWLETFFSQAAEGLRHMKMCILRPTENSWEHLLQKLNQQLTALATDNWENLLLVEKPNRQQTPSKRDRLIRFTRGIIVALLPAAALFSLSPFVDFGDDALKTARLATLGWAVLSIVYNIDPLFSTKLITLRGILAPQDETTSESKESKTRDRERQETLLAHRAPPDQ